VNDTLTTVTILYYTEGSLEINHEVKSYPKSKNGRVIIPEEFKVGKSIIAVCLGEVMILNKFGDRVMSVDTEFKDI